MKRLIFVFIVVILAISCKKNDYFIKQNHAVFCGVDILPFYFEGTISDTTNGNSLSGYTLHVKDVMQTEYNAVDTLSGSNYLIKFVRYTPFDSNYNEMYNKIQIRNLSSVVIDSFSIPVSYWMENDTAIYNYSF
ncbi:hypothetical protein N9P38_00365 [Flavobacteriales bacterium]|nr:hypothetical protein [Flavobacteriales bacterium]MDB4088739.1 hypothetical protein [Flavobacteriales bacterium]